MKKLSNALVIALVSLLTINSNAQNYSPSQYNPALWLDASVVSSVTQSNSSVSAWNDISGNGNHVTQSTNANKPGYAPNVNPGLYFDGSDVLIGNDSLLYGPDTIMHLFIVATPDPNADKGSVIAKGIWTSGADYRIELGKAGYAITVQGASEWNEGGGSWNVSSQPSLVSTYFSKDKEVGFFFNSVEDHTSHKNVSFSPNSTDFTIGARANYYNYFKGYIYEILMFHQELSHCEIQEIEGYLAHKWGVAPYFPPYHSYKSNAYGICDQTEYSIDEHSPNGTPIATLSLNSVGSPIIASNWRIENHGLYKNMFALNDTGLLTVNDNTNLDYELVSGFQIEVSTIVNGSRVYGGVRINLNDIADGGTPKTHSLLWGQNGELWDPRGRLPDFSFVGYKSGEQNYHYVNNTVDVTTFGANPNDSLSDYTAIVNAIASIDSGIVFFPPGLYVIDKSIAIQKNNIVLRGAGNDPVTGTKFYYPFDGKIMSSSSSFVDFGIYIGGHNAGPTRLITENTRMGDRSVTVNDASVFSVGDLIQLSFNGTHPANGELWNHILNDQNNDWPCTVPWSHGSSGLNMYHKIERIDGNIITLKEPIRLDLKLSWSPKIQLRTDWYISNCGIEDIYIEHKYIPQPPHLQEPGYNSILMQFAFDCWINNVTIKNADNGIYIEHSSHSEMKNITFEGRPGHHGWSIGYSTFFLAENHDFQNTGAWIHSLTLTHKAGGNVVSNVTGIDSFAISTDFHRNTPWETLITNVQNKWNYNSSGVYCAGPNAGKRVVYWNMDQAGSGFTSAPNWDNYQSTLVGKLNIPEQFLPERGWHENVPNIHPANLYTAQLNRRLNLAPAPNFQANTLGNRTKWWERDPARWEVKNVGMNEEYQLFFSETTPLSGGKLGEYSILDSTLTGAIEFSIDARSLERLDTSLSADFALVFNYQDDNNYYFLSINSDSTQSGLYKTVNGSSSLITSLNAKIEDNAFHRYSIKRSIDSIITFVDCVPIDTSIGATFSSGKIGIGTMDDAAAFDELEFGNVPQPTYYTLNDSTCANIPYIFDGKSHTNSGQFIHALGCDSIVTLNLTVLPAPNATITQNQDTLFAPAGYSNYQWLLNGIAISGANQDSYITNSQGSYSVIVTNANCSDTSQVLTITGLRELYLNNDVSIYPNPTQGKVFLEGYKENIEYIAVFNVMGQEVTSQVEIDQLDVSEISINMNELANGIYYIRTKTSSHLISLKKN